MCYSIQVGSLEQEIEELRRKFDSREEAGGQDEGRGSRWATLSTHVKVYFNSIGRCSTAY